MEAKAIHLKSKVRSRAAGETALKRHVFVFVDAISSIDTIDARYCENSEIYNLCKIKDVASMKQKYEWKMEMPSLVSQLQATTGMSWESWMYNFSIELMI